MLRHVFMVMFFFAPALHAATRSDIQVGDDAKTLIEKAGKPTSRNPVGSASALRSQLWVYKNSDGVVTYVVRDGKVRWISPENLSRD